MYSNTMAILIAKGYSKSLSTKYSVQKFLQGIICLQRI